MPSITTTLDEKPRKWRLRLLPMVALMAMVFSAGLTPMPAQASGLSLQISGDVPNIVLPSGPFQLNEFVVTVTEGGDPVPQIGEKVTVSLEPSGTSVSLGGTLEKTTDASGEARFDDLVVTGGSTQPVALTFQAEGASFTTDEFFVLEDFGFDSIEILVNSSDSFLLDLFLTLPVDLWSQYSELCRESGGDPEDCEFGPFDVFELVAYVAWLQTEFLFGTSTLDDCFLPEDDCPELFSFADQVLNSVFEFAIGGEPIYSNMRLWVEAENPQLVSERFVVPFVDPELVYGPAPLGFDPNSSSSPIWWTGDEPDEEHFLRFVVLGGEVDDEVTVTMSTDNGFSLANLLGFQPIDAPLFEPVPAEQVAQLDSVFSIGHRNIFTPRPILETTAWLLEVELLEGQAVALNDDFMNYAWSEDVQPIIDDFFDYLLSGSDRPEEYLEIADFLYELTENYRWLFENVVEFVLFSVIFDLEMDTEQSFSFLKDLLRPFCELDCSANDGESSGAHTAPIDVLAPLWDDAEADEEILNENLNLVRDDIRRLLGFYAEFDGFLNSLVTVNVDGEVRELALLFEPYVATIQGISDQLGPAAIGPDLYLFPDDISSSFEELSENPLFLELVFLDDGCTFSEGVCSLVIAGLLEDIVDGDLEIFVRIGGETFPALDQDPSVTEIPLDLLADIMYLLDFFGDEEWLENTQLFDFSATQRNFTLSTESLTITPEPGVSPGATSNTRGPKTPKSATEEVPAALPPAPGQSIGQLFGLGTEEDVTPEPALVTPAPTEPGTIAESVEEGDAITTTAPEGQQAGSSLWPLAIGAGLLLALLAAFAGVAIFRARLR